jgi:hypothetical protein
MQNLATSFPAAAVLESFRRVELAMASLIHTSQLPLPNRPLGGRRLAQFAFDADLISENELALFLDLSTLRNLAAHENAAIDIARATEFVGVAAVLYEALERISKNEDWKTPDH